MKRALAIAGVVAGLAVTAAPAQAALFGECDGKVDVLCQEHPCQPEWPCTIEYCLVWTGTDCGLT